MTHIWIPQTNYKEDTTVKRKIEVEPTTDGSGIVFKCPICGQKNLILSKDFSTNKSYSCFDCNYTAVFSVVPDSVYRYLHNNVQPVNVRPRIVRY